MKYFGTDGIRGKAEIFTDELLRAVSYAASKSCKKPLVVLGRDTRVSGREIENKLSKYLNGFGIDVINAGLTPTPVCAYLTRAYTADFGIMISASHNPPEYNGIKFFSSKGGKLLESDEDSLERHIEDYLNNGRANESNIKGTTTVVDGDNEYIEHLIALFKPKLEGLNVLLDCANGAMSLIAPKLFKKIGVNVSAINTEIDGASINDNCGATVIETLKKAMEGKSYDIGFSYDGDGDRLITVKDNRVIDGDHTIYIAARYFMAKGQLGNPTVVGTVMTNLGCEAAVKSKGLNLVRTKVGDKYVFDAMEEGNFAIGGEASGHLIFYKYQNTGDGLLASLILALIDKEVGLLSLDDIEEYPQVSKDIKTTKEKVENFKQSNEIKEFLKKVEGEINGRTVVRASGTEPKIRIMTEAKSLDEAESFATKIYDFIMRSI